MNQILLIGGSKDGEIKEGDFEQDGKLNYFYSVVTSSNAKEQTVGSTETYVMDVAFIGGKRYAYATCRSIQGYELIEIIKASELPPLE